MVSSDPGRSGEAMQGDRSGGPSKRLEAVRGTPDARSERAGREEAQPAGDARRGLPVWLFLLVFVLFSLALLWQVREARRLTSVVVTLEQDLAEARARLGAHRDHLGEIRLGVEGLSERLVELRRLVEAGPETVPGAGAGRTSSASGSRSGREATGAGASGSIPARLPES